MLKEKKTTIKKEAYLKRINLVKKLVNNLVRVRANKVAHFNIKSNLLGSLPIEMPMEIDPRYVKNIIKRLDSIFSDMYEDLKIDGRFMMSLGKSITQSFQKIVCKNEQGKTDAFLKKIDILET